MTQKVLIAVLIWVTSICSAARGAGAGLDVETIAMRQEGDIRFWWVKFLCGTIEPDATNPQNPASPDDPLVPGTYRTAINITTGTSLGGLKLSFAEAKPLGEPAAEPVERDLGVLIEGTAVEVDCKQATDALYPPRPGVPAPAFLKGFVRLFHPGGDQGPGFESSRARSVHVVAVYASNRVEEQAAPAP